MKHAALITIALATTATASPATPLTVGETFRIESAVLHETRTINVYLPPGYTAGKNAYPVLYMPDGGVGEDFPHISGLIDVSIKNEVIRPFIVVGVENTERRRDLLSRSDDPADQKIAPHAGGADAFRTFLRTELKPQIAARYRTTNESALIGESFAGLFVAETFFVEPTLFDTFISVSPSLWWNRSALAKSAPARLEKWRSATPKNFFMAVASDERFVEAGPEPLNQLMTAHAPAGVTWRYLRLPDEHHNTIFPVAALRAFRALFLVKP